jgi:hypothetical protein
MTMKMNPEEEKMPLGEKGGEIAANQKAFLKSTDMF